MILSIYRPAPSKITILNNFSCAPCHLVNVGDLYARGALNVGFQLRVSGSPVLHWLSQEESGCSEVGGYGLLQLVQQLVEAADVGGEVYDGGLHGLVDGNAFTGSGDLDEAVYDSVCLPPG